MSNVKISVIVPVYQVKESYLKECLHSILHQTLKETEILVVDDGAPERIEKVISHYARLDERIRVLRQQHAGASAARNTGLKAAGGRYVTFVDSDDYIAEDNLEKVYAFAENNELEIAIWGTYKCFPERREEYMPFTESIPLLREEEKRDLMLKTMVGDLPVYGKRCTKCGSGSCCAKLYLRSFLEQYSLVYPVGIVRSEDVNFNIRAFDKADRIGYLHQFFYFYRQLQDSATYRYREGGISVFEDALRGLKQFLEQGDYEELFYQAYYMRCVFFLLESISMDYMHPKNPKPRALRIRELRKKTGEDPFADAAENIKGKYLSIAKKIPVFLIRHRMAAMLAIFYTFYKNMKRS
ncbi:MAG: glycosyltransferase [Lachnospiraceae bacterium]|nr:glycosyltransferase [Lachnospiraceae bacterium]